MEKVPVFPFMTPLRPDGTFLYPDTHKKDTLRQPAAQEYHIMDRFPSGEERFLMSGRMAPAWHALSVALVFIYVNTFSIWAWIAAQVGPDAAAFLPYMVLAVALLCILAVSCRALVFNYRFFILAAAIAITALFLADPAFPAKRIHVAQYLVLSFILYRALAYDLPQGRYLVIAAAVMGSLYGIHDELLQGFHPDRTFGLRDIGIDILGAISGALAACAFVKPENGSSHAAIPAPDRPANIAFLAVIAGAVFLVLPLESYREQFIPAWSALPLLAAALCTALLLPGRIAGLLSFRIFAFAAFSLLLYPLASHVPTLRFH